MIRPPTLFAGLALCLLLCAQNAAAAPSNLSAEADEAQATARIVEIVNRPVTRLPRTDEAGIFSPGWFHDGAIKPDFAHVDIRATQEFPYKDFRWVSSDLNPDTMFVASELEFNAMTKYFYRDRSQPKHRLSEEDMLEINALYRRIASDEQAISQHRWQSAGLILVLLIVGAGLMFAYRRIA